MTKVANYISEKTQIYEHCKYTLKKAIELEATNFIENLFCCKEEMQDFAKGYSSYILK